MKKMWLNNGLKRAFIAMVATVLLGFISSCSNDDDDNNSGGGSGTSHKVIFKSEASPGSTLSNATYGYDSTNTSVTGLSGTTWSSPEITVPAGAVMVNVGVVGTGANAASTLKVQIYVDGQLKKETTTSGSTLSGMASYTF